MKGIGGQAMTELRGEYRRSVGRKIIFIASLLVLTVLLAGFAITLGSAGLTIAEVYIAIASRFLDFVPAPDPLATTVVWELRLHRVIFSMLAGFGLGIAGAVMQGVLKNPLASPFTLGISSAATFGAALAMVLGLGMAQGEYLVILNAFVFSLLATAGIYSLSRYRGISAESMVLAGIALMYLFSALTSFLQYIGSREQLAEVVFWMFGSLQRTSWLKTGILALALAVVVPYLVYRAWDLNAISQGDQVAASLGVRVERTRTEQMFIASLITASIIAFTGTIGFIGLVAPHITRLAIGGDHRFLLPGAGMVGSVLLLGADSLARTILAPVILPVGIMTAFIGIPFFLYLFVRSREGFW
ncbi:MAG: iron ABC transporter permease [Methanomicrobiales archaeon]|nr:iron ABC transporter permease [Methanomicrobiales archaeon]